jgi:hypothetical protein
MAVGIDTGTGIIWRIAMSDRMEKMLEALLKSDGLVYWIGGYVYGETSNGDPYILLYPSSEQLKEKVCRVYPHDFKKLPAFIPTADVRGATSANPSKGDAKRANFYHECPPFEIALFSGKDTALGPEKRFSSVLRLSKAAQEAVAGRPSPAPHANGARAQTAVAPPAPPAPPEPEEVDKDVEYCEYWTHEAVTADNALMFDTAVLKLYPDMKETRYVDWLAKEIVPAYRHEPFTYTFMLQAIGKYWEVREKNITVLGKEKAHEAAKSAAAKVYIQALCDKER